MTIPSSAAFIEWADGLAKHLRSSRAATVDRTLVGLAREVGYEEKPPVR